MRDSNDIQIDPGDIVRIPDDTMNLSIDNRYYSACRYGRVISVYPDEVYIRLAEIHDMRGGENMFEYQMWCAPSACTIKRKHDEVTVAPQPRDAQGRFTSSNTTVRPTVSRDIDGVPIIPDDLSPSPFIQSTYDYSTMAWSTAANAAVPA